MCELFIAPLDVCVNCVLSLVDVYVNFRRPRERREGREGGWEGGKEGTTFCYFVQCSPGTIRRAY